ncbi:hypothetical protein [Aureimonas glaciei]|uniref:Uncharacterized protein n=1 Tax=Aureimonas glaciei TaxID=1776957 RepID=A0A916YGF2_9HYPH|nr:hypothetical protein [Aureimonas glaciei]GGD43952.1 hypothetical protein GCM10011335_53220 [Aureimonas glaciei]
MSAIPDLTPDTIVVTSVAVTDQRIEDAVRYAVHGESHFETKNERFIAELAARKAISLLVGEVGMYSSRFVTEPDSREDWATI